MSFSCLILEYRSVFRILASVFLLLTTSVSLASDEGQDGDSFSLWQEGPVQMPAAPHFDSLTRFEVSAASANRFFVDTATISVGDDGVVRYVLVIQSAGGATNVSFEGMRCSTREKKVYASGRADGTWSKSREPSWLKIRDVALNRQHAVLFFEYFCPGGVTVRNSVEASEALRIGAHPDNRN